MLSKTKKTTLNGTSTVNGTDMAVYQATIDSENPGKITLTNTNLKGSSDAAVRQETRADYAEFLQTVYDLQDAMIAEKAAADESAE